MNEIRKNLHLVPFVKNASVFDYVTIAIASHCINVMPPFSMLVAPGSLGTHLSLHGHFQCKVFAEMRTKHAKPPTLQRNSCMSIRRLEPSGAEAGTRTQPKRHHGYCREASNMPAAEFRGVDEQDG
jgi:hypothetical protein